MRTLLALALFLAAAGPAWSQSRPVCVRQETGGGLACVSQDEFARMLREELAKIRAQEQKRQPKAPKGKAAKIPPLAPLMGDYWRYPLDQKWPISSPFGWRKIDRDGDGEEKDFHPGLDIAVYAYTPVYAARPGKVLYAGYVKGFGNCVVLEHANGYRSIYGHLSETIVRSGDRIARRIPLGLTGNTGSSLGAHLHFEVRTPKNQAVNPAPLIGVTVSSPRVVRSR